MYHWLYIEAKKVKTKGGVTIVPECLQSRRCHAVNWVKKLHRHRYEISFNSPGKWSTFETVSSQFAHNRQWRQESQRERDIRLPDLAAELCWNTITDQSFQLITRLQKFIFHCTYQMLLPASGLAQVRLRLLHNTLSINSQTWSHGTWLSDITCHTSHS